MSGEVLQSFTEPEAFENYSEINELKLPLDLFYILYYEIEHIQNVLKAPFTNTI